MKVNTEKTTIINFNEEEKKAIDIVYKLFDKISILIEDEYDGNADMIPMNGTQEVVTDLIELESFLNILDFEILASYTNWKIIRK